MESPAPRLWDSPRPFMGNNGRPGIGLVRIQKINSPYHTKVSKSIPSSSVDTRIPLEGKVALATSRWRVCKSEWNLTRTKSRTTFLPDHSDDCRSKVWIHTSKVWPGLVALHRTFTGSVERTVDDADSSTHQRGNLIRPGPRRCPNETQECLYGTP